MRRALILFLAVVAAAATVGFVLPTTEPGPTLREIASNRGIRIGAAISRPEWPTDPALTEKVLTHFNTVVPESEMKWQWVQPLPGVYEFSQADAIVTWAEQHGLEMRGGPLIWHNALPPWVEDGDWSRDELIAVMRDHIHTVVGRYRGRVAQWDVVNEAFEPNGSILGGEHSVWGRVIGPEFIDLAFEFAHEADPDAELFLTDYAAERLNAKSGGIYRFVKGMVARGVPIDAYGMQMHTPLPPPPFKEVATNMARFAELGLRTAFTEMDVRIEHPDTSLSAPSDYWLNWQAHAYRKLVDVCVAAPNCSTIIMWGVTDLHSWVPHKHPGYGWAHLWDKQYRAKPAFFQVRDSLLYTPTRGARSR